MALSQDPATRARQEKAIAFKAHGTMQLRFSGREIATLMRGANQETILAATQIVAERAKQYVSVKTGRLKNSIRGRVRKARNQDRIIGTVSTNTKSIQSDKRRMKEVAAGTRKKSDAPPASTYGYGLDQEIGRPDGKYKFKPYLRPALTMSIDEIQRKLKEGTLKAAAIQRRGKGRPRKQAA